MTPKQKAEDLVNQYRMILMDEDTDCGNEILCSLIAIKNALIAVDEILNANKEVMYSIDFVEYQDALNLRAKVKSETEIFVYYWQQVKQEIQKL
jgi:hypothetical protein